MFVCRRQWLRWAGAVLALSALSLAVFAGALLVDAAADAGVASTAFCKVKLTSKTVKVKGLSAAYDYTGNPVKPQVKVYYKKSKLKNKKDYRIAFKNNRGAGAAALVVKGKGAYKGKVSREFQIRYRITSASLPYAAYLPTGLPQTPKPVVKAAGKVLAEGSDYTLAYAGNVAVGTATVTATAAGSCVGSATTSFQIGADMSPNLSVRLSRTSYVYSGKHCIPDVAVYYGPTPLVKGVDYIYEIVDNTEIGTAKVKVTGLGENYDGLTAEGSFQIKSRSGRIVDVSFWNGKIDWGKAAGGIDLAILRSFRTASSHTRYSDRNKTVKLGTRREPMMSQDTKYQRNARGCERNGVPYAAYGYFVFTNAKDSFAKAKKDAKVQAERFWNTSFSHGRKPHMLVIDLEDAKMSAGKATRVVACTKVVIDRLQKKAKAAGYKDGIKIGLYIGNHVFKKYGFKTAAGKRLLKSRVDFIWIPSYGKNKGTVKGSAKPKIRYDMWQFTSKGRVKGIPGEVDMSVISPDGPNKRSLPWYLSR